MLFRSNEFLVAALIATGINPLPAVLFAIGYYKATTLLAAKMAIFGAKLGSFGGIIGSTIGFVLSGLSGLAIATTVIDALWEGKGIRVRFTWRPVLNVE